jgi:hypothetical protein
MSERDCSLLMIILAHYSVSQKAWVSESVGNSGLFHVRQGEWGVSRDTTPLQYPRPQQRSGCCVLYSSWNVCLYPLRWLLTKRVPVVVPPRALLGRRCAQTVGPGSDWTTRLSFTVGHLVHSRRLNTKIKVTTRTHESLQNTCVLVDTDWNISTLIKRSAVFFFSTPRWVTPVQQGLDLRCCHLAKSQSTKKFKF